MAARFPWYSTIYTSEPLEQGVIIQDFPMVSLDKLDYQHVSNEALVELPIDILRQDVIVMTQSCDLLAQKVKNVVLCPVYSLSEYVAALTKGLPVEQHRNKLASLKDGLKKSNYQNMILLDKCDKKLLTDKYQDFLIVKFDELIAMPLNIVTEAYQSKGRTVIVNPPYRESVAQAFGTFFMRIGNPVDYQPL